MKQLGTSLSPHSKRSRIRSYPKINGTMKAKKTQNLNLEKRHLKMSPMSQLKITDQEFVTYEKEVLAEGETFYKELYTSQKTLY